MAAYIHREEAPVCIDGEDFGFTCTLLRDDGVDYGGVPDEFGIVAFDRAQADRLMEVLNSHDDPGDPMHDCLQGSLSYDPGRDAYIEYAEDDFTGEYAMSSGFTVGGRKLYGVGADWCWTLPV